MSFIHFRITPHVFSFRVLIRYCVALQPKMPPKMTVASRTPDARGPPSARGPPTAQGGGKKPGSRKAAAAAAIEQASEGPVEQAMDDAMLFSINEAIDAVVEAEAAAAEAAAAEEAAAKFRSAHVDPGPPPKLAGILRTPQPEPLRLAAGQPLLLLPDLAGRRAGAEGSTRFGVVGADGRSVAQLMRCRGSGQPPPSHVPRGGDDGGAAAAALIDRDEMEDEMMVSLEQSSLIALPWQLPDGPPPIECWTKGVGQVSGLTYPLSWTDLLLTDVSTIRTTLRPSLVVLQKASTRLERLRANNKGLGEGAHEAKDRVASAERAHEDAIQASESAVNEHATAMRRVLEKQEEIRQSARKGGESTAALEAKRLAEARAKKEAEAQARSRLDLGLISDDLASVIASDSV